MPVTLEQLCEQSNYLYGMRVLAGVEGMGNIVQWVHAMEDEDAGSFLHGGELIFTTGIAHQKTDWLLPFIERLIGQKVSGLVINYGPYIEQVPKNIIEYCEKEGFPLLEVPWKTRLVDITRDFCNQIIKAERRDREISQLFSGILQTGFEKKPQIEALEKLGFKADDSYGMIAASFQFEEGQQTGVDLPLRIRLELEQILQLGKGRASYFLEKESDYLLTVILCAYVPEEVSQIVEKLQNMGDHSGYFKDFSMGVSMLGQGISTIPQNARKVQILRRMAKSWEQSPLYYDDLETEKVLISLAETEMLEEYYRKILGRLELYDRKNETEYMQILRRYIASDGSVQKVADEYEVHRNTINYQLGKIKKILGNELNSWQDRFMVMLALKVHEVL